MEDRILMPWDEFEGLESEVQQRARELYDINRRDAIALLGADADTRAELDDKAATLKESAPGTPLVHLRSSEPGVTYLHGSTGINDDLSKLLTLPKSTSRVDPQPGNTPDGQVPPTSQDDPPTSIGTGATVPKPSDASAPGMSPAPGIRQPSACGSPWTAVRSSS
jgi:hypothetical protein